MKILNLIYIMVQLWLKKIKQAKELKDLEKIYKKWKQEKVLKSKDKKEMAKLNDYIENEMFQKKINDNKRKKNELEKQKQLEKDAKNKEKKQKLEKIKEIQKNLKKINSEEEDSEKLEKKIIINISYQGKNQNYFIKMKMKKIIKLILLLNQSILFYQGIILKKKLN